MTRIINTRSLQWLFAKCTVVLVCSMMVPSLSAQSLSVGTHTPQIGDVVRYIISTGTFVSLPPFIARANAPAPWDFRELRPRLADTLIRTYGAVPDTLRSVFPTATMMMSSIQRTATNATIPLETLFLRTATDSLAAVGIRSVIAGQPLFYPYTTAETRLRLPMSVGTTYTRLLAAQTQATFTLSGIQLPVNVRRSGILRVSGEAGGSLVLPASDGTNRTIPSVLRVRTTLNYTDSVTFVGFPVPPTVLPANDTTLTFYASPSRYSYAEMNYGNQTTINETNPIALPPTVFSYRLFIYNNVLAGSTGIQSNTALRTAMQVRIAPNPVIDARAECVFTLAHPERISFAVVDGIGNEVLRLGTFDFPHGENSVEIPVMGLPRGTYFVRALLRNEMIAATMIMR